MKKNDEGESKNLISELTPYLGLGLQLAVTVTAMVFLGIWLDNKFDTSPIFTIICSFLRSFCRFI